MQVDYENSVRGARARDLFTSGYNCAQAVFLAYNDLYGLDEGSAAKLSSSFGGGLGRMREVCGAVSGMSMAAGLLYGYSSPDASSEKSEHYKRIQELAVEFKEQNGSIVCRELLGLPAGPDAPVASKRTDGFYKKRPCADLVYQAAAILEAYMAEHPLPEGDQSLSREEEA